MRGARLARAGALLAVVALLSGCAWIAQVDVPSSGSVANSSSFRHWLSSTGRYVVFDSAASNIVPGTPNAPPTVNRIYVRDQRTATTTLVRSDAVLTEDPGISQDLRLVLIRTAGGLLLLDRSTNTTEPVAVSSTGAPLAGTTVRSTLSADGRFVAFRQSNTSTGVLATYVRDRQTHTTKLLTSFTATPENQFIARLGDAFSLSADGSVLSQATCTVSATGRGGVPYCSFWSLQVWDVAHATSTSPRPDQAKPFSARLNANGRFLAYADDDHLWVLSLATGAQQQIDVGSTLEDTFSTPSISATGRYVTFVSNANLVPGVVPPDVYHVYVRDRVLNLTTLVSADAVGTPMGFFNVVSVISADGRYVTFDNYGTGLAHGEDWERVYTKAALIPRVSSVTPGFGARGGAARLTITGSGFRPDTVVQFGDGSVVLASVVAVTDTSMQVDVEIPADAPVAVYDVFVFDPGGGPGQSAGAATSCAHCFQITP